MELKSQREKAEKLRSMHRGSEILVLPNAWDAASAVIFAEAGFQAVASTSAGVAAVLGYPDGQIISRDEMVMMVGVIARAVDVPVTADMEAGYGDSPDAMVELSRALLDAGAVGLNLEDAAYGGDKPLLDQALAIEKIQTIRETSGKLGVSLVVNARTDVYLLEVGEPEERFTETVRRLNAYYAAGADSVFAPGVRDAETIGKLVQALDGPLNILAGTGTPPIAELAALGVRRVSLGSGPMRATMTLTHRIAAQLRDEGVYTEFTEGAIAHSGVNELMKHGGR
ncbi:MAG: isocitrate lyase/PEP mutase family protein [Chloroflexota bacterium]